MVHILWTEWGMVVSVRACDRLMCCVRLSCTEILMTELDPEAMLQFYKKEVVSAHDVTLRSGIADFLPGASTEEV